MTATAPSLVEEFRYGLDAPICLTWELTYACNLSCVHCLSSSGRRDPGELTTAECTRVIDELERMQVFYVNIGGGEPTVRPDFWELVDYATAHHVGVKFSTNGVKITPEIARRLAASDYVDVQISLDGATAEVNDAVRGAGSFETALRAMRNLAAAGLSGFKISVVMTRQNVSQLDAFKSIADSFGAQLRITRLRPSGRGADVWDSLHPTAAQQRVLYDWLVARGENVLTGDSFFHLAGYGQGLPGLNMCGAGRVVCLIDPVGDVYACPFAIHDAFLAGNVRSPGGFAAVWRESSLFAELRRPQSGGACASCGVFDACQGGCMAAKFFTGLPLDGPDPECVRGFGQQALAVVDAATAPRPSGDHSHRSGGARRRSGPVPVTIGRRPADLLSPGFPAAAGQPGRLTAPHAHACDENPLAGFAPASP
jgi:mycofactocin radical SAM maturase